MSQASIDSTPQSLLADLPLLAGLADRDLADLAAAAHVDRFEREAIIFIQADPSDRVWVVRSGQVKIVRQEADGREVILELIAPGEVFGGAVLFLPCHPATARAMTEVETISFGSEAYSRAVFSNPAVARRLVQMLGGRLQSMTNLQALAGERVERRLAHILVKLARRVGRPEARGTLVTIPLSRQDLADMAGTTLETAIRTMSRFRRHDLVETQRGGYLLIRDLERLEKLATAGEQSGPPAPRG